MKLVKMVVAEWFLVSEGGNLHIVRGSRAELVIPISRGNWHSMEPTFMTQDPKCVAIISTAVTGFRGRRMCILKMVGREMHIWFLEREMDPLTQRFREELTVERVETYERTKDDTDIELHYDELKHFYRSELY